MAVFHGNVLTTFIKLIVATYSLVFSKLVAIHIGRCMDWNHRTNSTIGSRRSKCLLDIL